MKLFFRTLLALLRLTQRRPPIDLLADVVTTFRVWPTDLDFNLHLNNARYLSMMDIGRLDLLARAGALRPMLRNRWHPVVGAVMLRFRRALDPWMKFQLRTRIAGWDEKWFYIEQRFERDAEVYAVGLVRAAIRGSATTLTPEQVVSAFGHRVDAPRLSAAFEEWRATLEIVSGRQPETGGFRRSA